MGKSSNATTKVFKITAVGLLGIAAFSAHAQSDPRVDRLEAEVRDLQLRLSKIEAGQGGFVADQKLEASGLGWKSLSNWRQLKTGMTPEQVRAILGEPRRITGGSIAEWFYPNGGVSMFMQEKLYRWTEPGQ
jgi:outer membrane protein assembly factor BamE (lipoprotein component of BamABCDE complex)